MNITSESIHVNKDDQKKQITRSNVKAVFVDKRQVVIMIKKTENGYVKHLTVPQAKLKILS